MSIALVNALNALCTHKTAFVKVHYMDDSGKLSLDVREGLLLNRDGQYFLLGADDEHLINLKCVGAVVDLNNITQYLSDKAVRSTYKVQPCTTDKRKWRVVEFLDGVYLQEVFRSARRSFCERQVNFLTVP